MIYLRLIAYTMIFFLLLLFGQSYKQLIYERPSTIIVKYDGINRKELKKSNQVTKVILYPRWKWNMIDEMAIPYGDLAIVHLLEPVVESSTVKIIPIAEKRPEIGSEVILTGWGFTLFDKKATIDDAPILLQKAGMTIISREQCNRMSRPYSPKPPIYICANSPTATACSVSTLELS